MTSDALQAECERGQSQLMAMEYLQAEATLAAAESHAWDARDWDTLARLYMPLQEARRQRRQRCGEGTICLDLISNGSFDQIDPRHVLQNFSHGQLLIAGWGSIDPAARVRTLAAGHGLYVDAFLAAAYPSEEGILVAIVPLADADLSGPKPQSIEQLAAQLPAHSIVFRQADLPVGSRPGSYKTYGEVMALWDRLHAPFLADADAQTDPLKKMEGYRTTIRVDYACELAHQKLSDAARQLLR